MNIKRAVVVITFIMCTLCVSAQSTLSFIPSEWNFGSIDEADGRVSHIFTGINTSSKPIVILEIYTACGCTVPEFSKEPILPGQERTIKVTFDPENRPGAFSKSLTVFDSGRKKIATLTIRGVVQARARSITELYPIATGTGLRLTQSLCTFSYIYHQRQTMSTIGIINDSSKPLRLELRPEQQSGYLMLDYPRQLAAGACGEIRISYLIPQESACYGTVRDVLIPQVDGKAVAVSVVSHGMAVDNSELSNEIYHPKVEVDKYILKFGLQNKGNGVQKQAFYIKNTGAGVLIIRAVEGSEQFGTTLRAGQRIEPGRSVTAYVTLDPTTQEYGPVTGYLTIVTNDTARPTFRIRATAIIEA